MIHSARADRLMLGLLALVYLVVATVVAHRHTMPMLNETDGVVYMLRADGPFFTVDPFHGPGYPTAIKVAKLLGMGTFTAAKAVSVFFGLLLLVALYRLVASFASPGQGLAAAAITAFSPLFVLMSTSAMSDVMGAALAVCAIALFVVPERTTLWHLIAAGVCVCAAYLTRYVYAFLLVLPLLVWALRARHWKLKEAVIAIAVFLASFELFGLPWFIYLTVEKGSPFWNLNHLNVAYKIFYEVRGWRFFPTEADFSGWWDVVKVSPVFFMSEWWKTARELPGHLQALLPGAGLVVVVGLIAWLVTMNRRKAVFLLMSALFFALVCLVWLKGRFFLFLLPITATFAAAGLALLPAKVPGIGESARGARWLSRIPLRVVAVVLLLAVLGAHAKRTVQSSRADPPVEYRDAGEWIRAHSSGDVSVMASKPHMAFFAGAEYIDFWYSGAGRIRAIAFADLLREIEPDYLVFDMRYGYGQFPRLHFLQSDLRDPFVDILRLVHIVDQRVYVYEYVAKTP